MIRKGLLSGCGPASPITAPPPTALEYAQDLAAILAEIHHIRADVHELASGNAIVSVHYGLLAYTDGERFWWTGPELNHAGSPLLSSELTLLAAARQLAEHHAVLRDKDAADLLRGGLPLLADVILAEHVDPR
ncbi:hypothetical protein ACFQVD_29300 [Streptosporangium amethystogenes subsp. fukuiense]|uniref:Uncharacterized protein n=1 Tax=Streptosporangium amethystogenes subsp. fukuiense TaxID=698418 RepID=A0ABW2T801_9ACTN